MSRENLVGEDRSRPETPLEELDAAFCSVACQSALLVQAAAERLGMAVTDIACLSILLEDGPATPGHLAARLGVTSGAVTGIVDRLAAQGRVRRTPDPSDRRRAIVVPVTGRSADVTRLLSPCSTAEDRPGAGTRLPSGTLRELLLEARDMAAERLEALRSIGDEESLSADGVTTVARGTITAARLKLGGLSAGSQITVGDTGAALCKVSGAGGGAQVKLRGTTLSIRVRQVPGAGSSVVELSDAVEWTMEMSGGTHEGTIDLRGAKLAGISMSGGTSRLEVLLPEPSRVVPVRVSGGTSHLALRRPPGVAVALRLRGGASDVVMDGSEVARVGGSARVGAQLGSGERGYEVDVSGGSSHLEIG